MFLRENTILTKCAHLAGKWIVLSPFSRFELNSRQSFSRVVSSIPEFFSRISVEIFLGWRATRSSIDYRDVTFLLSTWKYIATVGDSKVEDLSISGQAWIQRQMDFLVARKSTGTDNSDPIGVPEIEDERSSKDVYTRRILEGFTIERQEVAKRRLRRFDDRRYEDFEGKLVALRCSVSKWVLERSTYNRSRISFPSSVRYSWKPAIVCKKYRNRWTLRTYMPITQRFFLSLTCLYRRLIVPLTIDTPIQTKDTKDKPTET